MPEAIHLLHHTPCALEVRTTGPLHNFHDIWEIAIIPLTHGFQPDKRVLPFHVLVKPRRPNNADFTKFKLEDRTNLVKFGMDAYDAIYSFERWSRSFPRNLNKRFIPVTYDWAFVRPFIMDLFGANEVGTPYAWDFFIPELARDLRIVANYFDDLAWFNSEPYPIKRPEQFGNLCTQMKVTWRTPHDALSTALATMECYAKMAAMRLPTGFELDLRLPEVIDYTKEPEDATEPNESLEALHTLCTDVSRKHETAHNTLS